MSLAKFSALGSLFSPAVAAKTAEELHAVCEPLARRFGAKTTSQIDESTVFLLAYPDHVSDGQTSSLRTLKEVVRSVLSGCFSHMHILPPFLSDGDGGFALIDHARIEPAYGGWRDLVPEPGNPRISLDLILNHVSPGHAWFNRSIAGDPAYEGFFIDVPKDADFGAVARSVHHPPYTDFSTAAGCRRYWTRYGPGQVDLNYRNPKVLLAMVKVAVSYLEAGVGGLRLDAIAFAWKDLATSCSNLPETRSLVSIFRDVVDSAHSDALLISETDVVMGDNPYVGNGTSHAHLAYRYESAPIILHALLTGTTSHLVAWLNRLRSGTSQAVFNFISTHDGLYLRPMDPFLDDEAIDALARAARAAGGRVRERIVHGELRPYELNVSVVALLSKGSVTQFDKLFSALAIVMFLPGIPLVYLGNLLGLGNHPEVAEDPRLINRCRAKTSDLPTAGSQHARFLEQFRELTIMRRRNAAFRPGNDFSATEISGQVLALDRIGPEATVRCYLGVGRSEVLAQLPPGAIDALSGKKLPSFIRLTPFHPVFIQFRGRQHEGKVK